MSASVIDAFVATLGLDGTLFRKGMQDAEKSQDSLDKKTKKTNKEIDKGEKDLATARKKRQKEQDDAGKKTSEGYKKVRTELLGIAAIFTAGVGFKNFIANTIDGAANLGYLSANLRMSTQQLTSWQRASERAGGSADGIIGQLKESADTLAQLKSGFGPNEGLQNFFRFGGNADELKDGNTYLLARSRIISEMFKQDPSKAALIARQMGVSEDQFNFLKQGPAAVLALVQAQEKNAAVTAKDAEAALALRNRVLDLRDSLQATATRIILQLAPTIEKLFARLEEGSQWVVAHKDDIARWVENCIVSVTRFAKTADDAAKAVGGWQNVLIALAALKAISMAADFISLAGALVKVGSALGAIGGMGGAAGVLGKLGQVGLAGAAGYGVGTLINDYVLPDSWKEKIGSGIGHAMAFLGSSEAREAVAGNDAASRQQRTFSGKVKRPDAKGIVDKLTAMGWSKEQAAGIAGSFAQESGMDPTARNPKSGAYGIGQWLGSRVGDFKAFSGRDLVGSSLDQQLAFFNYEVTQGKEKSAGNRLRATRTAEEAARVHSEAYERPGSEEANIARRQALAAQYAATDRAANASAVGSVPSIAAASIAGTGAGSTSTSTTDVRIDNITVNTQATDAQGIASALRPAIEKYNFGTQANTGMR